MIGGKTAEWKSAKEKKFFPENKGEVFVYYHTSVKTKRVVKEIFSIKKILVLVLEFFAVIIIIIIVNYTFASHSPTHLYDCIGFLAAKYIHW